MKNKLPMIFIAILLSIVLWLSISLSNTYYEIIDMPLQIAELPEGKALGTKVPNKVSLRLETTGWKLISLYLSDELAYSVNIKDEPVETPLQLTNSVSENSWITSEVNLIEISPSTLDLSIDPLDSMQFPVQVNLDYVQLKDGYILARDIEITPDSVMVYGSKKLMRDFYAIETEPIRNRALSENVNRSLNLQNITGLQYKPNQVNVLIDVQLSVDRTFEKIPIHVTDIPPDRNVLLMPGEASVKVRGGIEVLGTLQRSDFKLVAKFNDILSDTIGSVEPTIILPENVTLVDYKPQRFRYIVKKF